MASDEILGKEKIVKLCFKMGLPCILAQLVNLLYTIVDRIYIGHMAGVGKVAIGGLGVCAPIIILLAAFSAFVSGGGAPLSSKALGEGDRERAQKILNNGFVLLVVFAVVLGAIAFIFKLPILRWMKAKPENIGYANDYLTIYLLGTLFVQISTGLNTFLTAQGKSVQAMLSVIIGAVLNIAFDPLFIFALNMGIKGAALATIISQGVSAVYVLKVLTDKRSSLRLDFKYMRIDWGIVRSIMALGLAPFVMAATESVIGFALNGRLSYYGELVSGKGEIYVSSLAILQSVMMLITVPVSGFTQGVTPILSYNYGAKNKERLVQCYLVTVIGCFGYCCLSAILMMSVPHLFGSIFTSDPELLSLTDKYLPVFVAGMLIFGVQRACQTTFVAMTQAKISLLIAIMRKIILLVPLAYILPIFMGVGGVYWAECIADLTAATICGTIFFFKFRKILREM